MPRPTRQEWQRVRSSHSRLKTYENRFSEGFFKYLQSVYAIAATTIEKQGIDAYLSMQDARQMTSDLSKIYERMYKVVTLEEAQNEASYLEGTQKGRKDLIDDFARAFPYAGGSVIQVFRQLLNDYLSIRIGTRITQVTANTVKYIGQIIEKGIADGLSAIQIAELIRRKTDFNRYRSVMIARTETVTAMNQGKFMAAQSSDLVYEKRWIPADQPGRTRPSHLAMLDSPFIDLNQDFQIGNSKGGVEPAKYPGDERLSAENTVNCRCQLGFRVKRDRDGNPIRKRF